MNLAHFPCSLWGADTAEHQLITENRILRRFSEAFSKLATNLKGVHKKVIIGEHSEKLLKKKYPEDYQRIHKTYWVKCLFLRNIHRNPEISISKHCPMYQINIQSPNPKFRLYWCSIEFIDWRYSQSCWHFRPLLWTGCMYVCMYISSRSLGFL